MSDNLPAPTFSWLLASFTLIPICRFVDVVALHSMTVALSKWGSPGPTSRCRGVSLWCTGPTRAPLKIHHCQFLQLLFLLFIIKTLCHALLAGRLNTFVTVLFLPRAFNAAQPNTLFSLIHYSLPRISRAAQYLVVTQNGCPKK